MPRLSCVVQYPGERTASPFTFPASQPPTASEVIQNYLATRPGDPESPTNFAVREVAPDETLDSPMLPDQALTPDKQYRVVRRTALAAAA